jgi:putative Mn2+ efflux pump MntP
LSVVEIILLAIALGIDCLVVSFSQGLLFNQNKTANSLKLALIMGIFQGGMPIIGYVGANKLYDSILPYSKWIVFWIFFILGLKFIIDSFKRKKVEVLCFDINCLLALGFATSIDALISGTSLRLLHANLMISVIIIGFTSFIMSLIGFWSGNHIKFQGNNINKNSSRILEISGGIILILLALKALFVG